MSDIITLSDRLKWAADFYERTKDPEVGKILNQLVELRKENPLLFFEPHKPGPDGRRPQLEFIQAKTPRIAAIAGTRFGKSTVLGITALREALPREVLPPLLAKTKRFDAPTHGWIMLPTEAKITDSFEPVFKKWCPPAEFFGGSYGRAFNGASFTLRFKCGSSIAFKTYKQDASTLGGAGLHWVGYDEPPPRKHVEEGGYRLNDTGGFEMFAFTPLDTNTGFVHREIYKKREDPDITVVRGSIHDNKTLDAKTVARNLARSDLYRKAREFGDFVLGGGLIYPDFDRCVVEHAFSPAQIRTWDIVVGIDPGMRNCGIVWVGFDDELVAHVFHEELMQDCTAKQYAERINKVNAIYGIRPSYVVDPAAKQRAQANGMTVLAELINERIYPNIGQNDHELGFGQVRVRMDNKRLLVSPLCRGLRDEADEYAGKEPEEGQDDSHIDPIKGNDHRLDALRYAIMERYWDPEVEADAPNRQLGWRPGQDIPDYLPGPAAEAQPMGFMM